MSIMCLRMLEMGEFFLFLKYLLHVNSSNLI